MSSVYVFGKGKTKKVLERWMEMCMLFLTESNPFFKVTNDLKIFLPLMIYLLVSRCHP